MGLLERLEGKPETDGSGEAFREIKVEMFSATVAELKTALTGPKVDPENQKVIELLAGIKTLPGELTVTVQKKCLETALNSLKVKDANAVQRPEQEPSTGPVDESEE